MTEIGRNAPCPCGSGQKYKKCCLAKNEAARAADRPPQNPRDRVMPALLRFAFTPQFDGDHDIAMRLFWADRLDSMRPEAVQALLASDDAQVKYNAWFVWDLEIEDGLTVADLFLARRGRLLDTAERAFIDCMRRSHLRLYQIEMVDRGVGVTLRDLWTKDTVFVHERLGSEQLVRWDVIAARVATHREDHPEFEGGMYLYQAADKAELLRVLRGYHRSFRRRFPRATLADFFKRHAFVFNHLWLDLVVARPLPKMLTAEGDDMMFTRSVFDVVDPAALRSALEQRDDVDLTDDGAFIWLEDDQGFRRTLGTFRLEGSRLTLETVSRARDERGRAWLAQAAPALTTYRATEIETVAQALAKRRDASAEREDDLPADVRASIEQEMMDQHYRKWLDQPIPALAGSTPREAAASRTLRPLLIDLLRELNNRCERNVREGRPAYDPSWIWSELRLKG